MLAEIQQPPFVGHKGPSPWPAALSSRNSKYSLAPLSEISNNTRYNDRLSRPIGSHVPQVRSGKTTNITDLIAGRPPIQHGPLMTSGAGLLNERNSSSKSPEHDAQSFTSTTAVGILSRQDLDAEPSSPIPDDAAMASLISRMQDNVVIRDVAVQTPSMIEVPKGYAVTYDTKPAEHYKDRRNVKVHVKRKRNEGILSKPSRRLESNEIYGFRPHEINSAGAVSLENCQASNLTNKIHPLLARARFDDTPDAIYDQLVPALRLASMFLSQPVCMQYWVTLALAERRDDPKMSLKYGKRCQRIHNHIETTNQNIAAVTKHLEVMGNTNLIHFAFRHKTAMPQTDIWGCSWPIRDYHGGKEKDLTRSLIILHADYYIVAEKLSQLKYPEQSQNLRFSFIFAVIVLHELAHSIEGAYIKMRHDQWLDLQHTKQYLEPFFMDWQRPPECGRTLEQTMFGGEIHPINKKVDGSHGVCTSDWPPHSSTADSERRTWFTIPMEYIQNLFRMETWQRRSQLRDWTTFHIPRTGATSLYIFSFTTMPWSEEQRAANEEAAELLAIAKAQPATKKRLISSGKGEEQRFDETAVIETVIGREGAAEVERGRRASKFSHVRRHSSFILGTLSGGSHAPRRSRRSRSLVPGLAEVLFSQDQPTQEAAADELLCSFMEIYDGLPTHRGSDDSVKKPTSELVKARAKQPPAPRPKPDRKKKGTKALKQQEPRHEMENESEQISISKMVDETAPDTDTASME